MPHISPRIIYSPAYNFRSFGLEKLHPFDARKYERVWQRLQSEPGLRLRERTVTPQRGLNQRELLAVHSAGYLKSLKKSATVAKAVEIPPLAVLPHFVLQTCLLRPMLMASMGTTVAGRIALKTGAAINLGGGYHHASAERGEGFSIYADVAIAFQSLRQGGELDPALGKVAVIDLDAHQGNGNERTLGPDPQVAIFDMYNSGIYPKDTYAKKFITRDLPLRSGIGDDAYLDILKSNLPDFLREHAPIALAFYNAGTDVHASDLLGGMKLSEAGVLERDEFVFRTLSEAGIPWVMVLSGGYSRISYQLVASSVISALRAWPA